ncbi:ribosomal protein S5 domain 2-type protein [Cladochytrium replicatum]|nr:ribosomal protein S5 domain 2-type protein [Cladochytrium replicatum]
MAHSVLPFSDFQSITHWRVHIGAPIENLIDIAVELQSEHAVCLAKSPNKHNRLFVKVERLDVEIISAVESGARGFATDQQERAVAMLGELGWNMADAVKVWCFGSDQNGPNMLVDMTKKDVWLMSVCVEFVATSLRGMGQIIPALRRTVNASVLTAPIRSEAIGLYKTHRNSA